MALVGLLLGVLLLAVGAERQAAAMPPCDYGNTIAPPCSWPSSPPAGLPFARSTTLQGIEILENATSIPDYGADTWYPAEDRHGDLFSGFDDGGVDGVSVGSACTRTREKCASGKYGFHTGSAVVSGDNWRNLSVRAPGGAIFEDGFPMQGRYTCANAVANGTWWVGSYGLAVGDASCEAGTGVLQFCEMGPFVGFRSSTDAGASWKEPRRPGGSILNVSSPLFDEAVGASIKLGAPHIVDFGPENELSPDGHLYAVGNGCLAAKPNSNCSWISGDAVFMARASGYSAAEPDSLNDPANWEFFCGKGGGVGGGECWTSKVAEAKPILTWEGRVGTVTSTWHPGLKRFLFAITTPTVLPSTVGPYDTFVLEAPSLTGPFTLVSYMPKFGQQAYFVSFPSKFLGSRGGGGDKDAVMAFSANFACKTGGCKPNIEGAKYGATLLPVRLGGGGTALKSDENMELARCAGARDTAAVCAGEGGARLGTQLPDVRRF